MAHPGNINGNVGDSSSRIAGELKDGYQGVDHDTPADHSLPHPEELDRTYQSTKNNNLLKTIAGVAGNVLEWYDFAVFGFFGDIIGKVFFPPQKGHAAMVESFVVFGCAFLMRPIGGMLLGYIGDLYGRKKALEISIFLMAFPTFLMGCLPTYNQVGGLAIVLLLLVRLLQGLSVGGQLVSSLVFTVESQPKEKWGLYGSYVMAAANFGTLLGGVVAFIMRSTLDEKDLTSWGWRIPFMSGVLVSFSGLYLRFYCEDDNMDHIHGANPSNAPVNPIKAAFSKKNRRSLLSASLVPMLWSSAFYITFVWMALFMEDLVDPPVPGAFGVNSASLLTSLCILFPFAGILSDMYGRKKVMYTGGIALGLLNPIMLKVISNGNPIAAFFAQSALGIALSLWGAPMCAWLVESFSAEVRLTSVAVGYNIAQATAGGSSPAIATWLSDNAGLISPGFQVLFFAILSIAGLYFAPPNPDEESKNERYTEESDAESEDHRFVSELT